MKRYGQALDRDSSNRAAVLRSKSSVAARTDARTRSRRLANIWRAERNSIAVNRKYRSGPGTIPRSITPVNAPIVAAVSSTIASRIGQAVLKKRRCSAARACDDGNEACAYRRVNVHVAEHRQDGNDKNPARHAKHATECTSHYRDREQPQHEAAVHFNGLRLLFAAGAQAWSRNGSGRLGNRVSRNRWACDRWCTKCARLGISGCLVQFRGLPQPSSQPRRLPDDTPLPPKACRTSARGARRSAPFRDRSRDPLADLSWQIGFVEGQRSVVGQSHALYADDQSSCGDRELPSYRLAGRNYLLIEQAG
jgi:hypothetical protein